MEQNLQRQEVYEYDDGARGKTPWRVVRLPGALRPSTLEADAATGLSAPRKHLPPKYFYDARGSALFERICATPEYYPTRTESALLAAYARGILEEVRPATLVELGSGSSHKTDHFFAACEQLNRRVFYQPLDVCAEALSLAAMRLKRRYPWLDMELLVGDYGVDLAALPSTTGRRLFLFLGGTIGNLTHSEALEFLHSLRAVMHDDDYFLLGFDRVKDKQTLDAAYNDQAGYTADFNGNVLHVLNARLNASFDPSLFSHEAFFNPDASQVEMYLRAGRAHEVELRSLALRVRFADGETILTEISRKFTPEGMRALLEAAGFRWCRHWEPDNGFFSLALVALHPRGAD